MPHSHEPVPCFNAAATHGTKTLGNYRGKWHLFCSRPIDITPVCTNVFMAFAKRHEMFQAGIRELLGLSIESHYSHVAWKRHIERKPGQEPAAANTNVTTGTSAGSRFDTRTAPRQPGGAQGLRLAHEPD